MFDFGYRNDLSYFADSDSLPNALVFPRSCSLKKFDLRWVDHPVLNCLKRLKDDI